MGFGSQGSGLGRRGVVAGLAAATAGVLPRQVRAQAKPLKIGVILPRSGPLAVLGQSCARGADVAGDVLKELGYTYPYEILNADSETNPDTARARAERLVDEGASVIIGPFDSPSAMTIAQVTEQRRIPFVVNIAAITALTEQGFQYVFRNFPTSEDLIVNGLRGIKEVFAASGAAPRTAVLLHVNDAFGQANKAAIDRQLPNAGMPFRLLDSISYDLAARDLSVEVAKAKATGAELVLGVGRLNDSILMIREMVKQRWEPQGIMSPGSPGMYEEQFLKTLGKYAEYVINVVPWYNPRAELAEVVGKAYDRRFGAATFLANVTNFGYTFEAVMVAVDAAQRANSADPQALQAALRETNLARRFMLGGPIRFDRKGQAVEVASAIVQNLDGKPQVVLPESSAQAKLVYPLPGWSKRG